MFIVFVIGNEPVSNPQFVQQDHGTPGVFRSDQVCFFQHLPAAGGKISRIPDRSRHYIQASGKIILFLNCIIHEENRP